MSTELDVMRSIPVVEETEEGFDFRGFITRYIKYWPLLLGLVLGAILLSYLYLRYTPKSYKADAMLAIKKDNELTGEGSLRISLMDDKITLEKEVELLKSPDAIEQTVIRLKLYSDIKSVGRIQKKDLYGVDAPFLVDAENPDKLGNSAALKVSVDTSVGSLTINGTKYGFDQWHNTPWGRLKFSRNPLFKGELDNYEMSIVSLGMKSFDLSRRLSVDTKTKLSELIILSVSDLNQQRAVDILRTIVAVYDEITVGTKKTAYMSTYKFIDDRLSIVEKELSGVESEVQKYKANEGVFDLSTQGTAFLQGVQESDQEVAKLNLQLELVNKARTAIRSTGDGDGTLPAVDLGDSPLTKQISDLNETSLQLSKELQLSGPDNPRVKVLQERSARLKGYISEGLDNMRKNLETSRNFYMSKQAGFNAMLRGIPQKERGLIDITRQQAIKNGIFSFLLQKREEAAISVAGTVANSQFIRKPMPGGVLKPVALKTNAMALFAALGIFGMLLFIRQLIWDNFEDKKEAEKKIGAPIAGSILFSKKKKNESTLVVGDGKGSVEAEQFRDLRTNLNYLGLHDENKVLLVTSSQPGEGKTYISFNLAVSMALTGKKVALLGLDFRKPQLSIATGVSNKPGITDYLVGMATYEEIVKPFSDNENVFILPAGSLPPNPTELIMDEKMGELITRLRKDFHFVIFDTPPIGAVTDAKVLAKYANTTLYVMRYGHTNRSFYSMIKDVYVNKKFPNLGLVLNGIKENRLLRYNQRYGYGYHKDS